MAKSWQCALWDNRMAYSKDDYMDLAEQIRGFLSNFTSEEIWEHRNSVKFVKSQFVSFAWSIYWRIDYNRYSYTNTQTETALKRILSSYSEVKK